MTLTEFLTLRLDEDEAAARAAEFQSLNLRTREDWHGRSESRIIASAPSRGSEEGDLSWLGAERLLAHIARQDPARVLDDVAAKREVLGMYDRAGRSLTAYPNAVNAATLMAWQAALRALARPYADHPDYDPAWA